MTSTGQVACAEDLTGMQAMAARSACEQMTAPAMKLLLDSVVQAASLPTKPGWERKAAAHAEFFRLLAGVAGGAPEWLAGQSRLIRDLMYAAGPAANGMITSSRQRLLARLRAGDADGAALEVEAHLRILHFMGRLAASGCGPHGECADHQNHVMRAHQVSGEAHCYLEGRRR
jgi:DNA-binding GntR family transcriptional regulator